MLGFCVVKVQVLCVNQAAFGYQGSAKKGLVFSMLGFCVVKMQVLCVNQAASGYRRPAKIVKPPEHRKYLIYFYKPSKKYSSRDTIPIWRATRRQSHPAASGYLQAERKGKFLKTLRGEEYF
jgi:hypothetical protein